MKTATKIAIARTAYTFIHGARRLMGRPDRFVAERKGVKYELDLSEGIDFSIYLLGSFEPSTADCLRRMIKPGQTVLDIGANIGAHTLTLAQCVGPSGRVFAFEPTDYASAKIRRNLSLNTELSKRVTFTQAFLTHEDEDAVPAAIYSSWPLAADGELHEHHLGQLKETSHARCMTVDGVLQREGVSKVDLVKLDVDGFECDVLRGATAMISRDHPIFVMELAPYVLDERGSSLEKLLALLVPYGYRFFEEKTGAPLPVEVNSIRERIPVGASINVYAVAGSRV